MRVRSYGEERSPAVASTERRPPREHLRRSHDGCTLRQNAPSTARAHTRPTHPAQKMPDLRDDRLELGLQPHGLDDVGAGLVALALGREREARD